MLTIKNITITLSGDPLLKEVSLVMHKNDRIGIVGPNGAGKSTLFKTILGKIEPDLGRIEYHNERMGYMPQEPDFGESKTIGEYLGRHKDFSKVLAEVGLSTVDSNVLLTN